MTAAMNNLGIHMDPSKMNENSYKINSNSHSIYSVLHYSWLASIELRSNQ